MSGVGNNGPMPNGGGANSSAYILQQQQLAQQMNISTAPPVADVLTQLEDYTPTIPDSVTQHFLSTSGLDTDDPRIIKLVSLATQKFISDIANDALQHCKMRGGPAAGAPGGPGGPSGGDSKKNKDRKFTMTTEDLSQALADQGVTLKKPPYYV